MQGMTPEQAISIIDQGLGMVDAKRDVHIQLQMALNTLRTFVGDHATQPDPAPAATATTTEAKK